MILKSRAQHHPNYKLNWKLKHLNKKLLISGSVKIAPQKSPPEKLPPRKLPPMKIAPMKMPTCERFPV